ncbi:MAG: SIS domain-containing protein [Myxococcales bacterium]|nr:SIS domain-containing protein [Myxococcales bacterium]
MSARKTSKRSAAPRSAAGAPSATARPVDAAQDGSRDLELVGFGSMVLDRIHRTRRVIGANEKALLDAVDAQTGPVRTCVGGLMLNQLGWAALFGLRVGIFGRQAEDEAGRVLRAAMARHGIETHLDRTASGSSIAEIFVDAAGERAIYMAAAGTAETRPRHVHEDHSGFVARAARLTTEISQLPLDTALAALELARAMGIGTVVDLDVRPSDAVGVLGDRETFDRVLRAADLLKPTEIAARELFPELDSLEALARRIRETYGVPRVVMTLGEAGALLSDAEGERLVPAYGARAVVDSTGAGDAFLGGYLAGETLGLAPIDAVRLGNACGAACVERVGAFPDEPEVLRARVLELYAGPEPADARWGEAVAAKTQGASSGRGPAQAGLRVLEVAAREIAALAGRHDGASILAAAELIERAEAGGGRVHVTGVGKPEHVAHYAASLLASTGTPATFLHATESLHGSLGQIVPGDVVIAISNSGTTGECLLAARAVRDYGGRLIAVTGGLGSALAELADVTLDAGVSEEGGPLGLAPRASVAAEILVLAALGAVLQERRGLDRKAYAARHPAGALGKQARGES